MDSGSPQTISFSSGIWTSTSKFRPVILLGEPPRSVQNLLTVAQIKADAHRVYLVEIKENAAGITFRMFERAKLNVANLPLLLDKNKPLLSFIPDKKEPCLYYRKQKNSPDTLTVIRTVLTDCAELLLEKNEA